MKLGCSHAPASRLSGIDSSNIILIVISSVGFRLEIRESVFGAAFRWPENYHIWQALKLAYYAGGAYKRCQNMKDVTQAHGGSFTGACKNCLGHQQPLHRN